MRIGEYEIKWDGVCYRVGKPVMEKRKGVEYERITDPKFYVKLEDALASLPDRMISDVFNSCGDLTDLRRELRRIAHELVEPLENAVHGVPRASDSDFSEDPVSE